MAEIEVPPYFICPITLEIMKDPVTISTGITYDRDSIEKWIFSKNNSTCPVTKQLLSDTELTPNITLRRLIQSWCTLHASHGVQRLPTPKPPVTKSHISKLLNDIDIATTHPHMQINSLQTLKSLASESQTNKRSIESVGAADFLASLITKITLRESQDHEQRKACEEALSFLYSLHLSESSLRSLTVNVEFFDSLTRVMKCGSYESRAYAIMLLKSMLEVADPSPIIHLKPDFFVELAQILKDQICQKASKAALRVLVNVCPWGRNRYKAIESGLVAILIDLLLDSSDKRACEMALIVLDLLCQMAEGRAELLKHGAGLAIVSKKILRISQSANERAVRILHSISKSSATPGVVMEMLQIGVVGKLCLVVQADCGSKTKERAREILKLHARAWRRSICIPFSLISSYPS